MKISTVIEYLETYFPLNLSCSWDNSGLQLGNVDNEISSIMIALTPDLNVIEECINQRCNFLITHHPLFFGSIKTIPLNSEIGKIIEKSIKSNLTIYSLHTCLDIGLEESMNHWIINYLGFNDVKKIDDEGLIKATSCDLTFNQLVTICKDKFCLNSVKIVGNLNSKVSSFAVVGGSGADYITLASEHVDCLITGDLKYHDAQKAISQNLMLIDIGHFAEHICLEYLKKIIEKQYSRNIYLSKQTDYFQMV